MTARKKELEDLLHYSNLYHGTKLTYDELKCIKWKGKRENFEAEHERDLKMFHIARRKLEKHIFSAGKIPVHEWQQELASLQQKYQAEYERYKPMHDDLMKLLRVKNCVDTALHPQQPQKKRHEMER